MLDVSRRELKYSISEFEAARIRRLLKYLTPPDPHNGIGGYLVRSLYFDSIFDNDFEEKVDGVDHRRKIRLRIYSPDDRTAKLELKQKYGSLQRKRSVTVTREEAQTMISGSYEFLRKHPEPLAEALYMMLMTGCYIPRCIVEYDREAYCRDVNDTRITFDSRLRASEANLNLFDTALITYPVLTPGQITMEVKFNRFLMSDIKDAVTIADRLSVSNSKYCAARAITKRGRK